MIAYLNSAISQHSAVTIYTYIFGLQMQPGWQKQESLPGGLFVSQAALLIYWAEPRPPSGSAFKISYAFPTGTWKGIGNEPPGGKLNLEVDLKVWNITKM